MIKDLIKDIAYDKINLSQALTRAKIIAYKLGNKPFQEWLKNELQSYESQDDTLPSYRSISCIPYITVDYGFGHRETIPVDWHVSSKSSESDIAFSKLLNSIQEFESISTIEAHIQQLSGPLINFPIIPRQLLILERLFSNQLNGGKIIDGYQQASRSHLVNIIDQTKQALLETLMELDNEFPNLDNDFIPNDENTQKVQNIITTNIYGSNNTTNSAAGHQVTQQNTHTDYRIDYQDLSRLGVDDEQLNELKSIVSSQTEKSSLGGKLLKWLGAVTASVASKGLVENIPAITEQIHKLLS